MSSSLFYISQMTLGFGGFVTSLISILITAIFGLSSVHTIGVQTFLFLKGTVPMTWRDVYMNTLILGCTGTVLTVLAVGAVISYVTMTNGYLSLTKECMNVINALFPNPPKVRPYIEKYDYVFPCNLEKYRCHGNFPADTCCTFTNMPQAAQPPSDPANLNKLWDEESQNQSSENQGAQIYPENTNVPSENSFEF